MDRTIKISDFPEIMVFKTEDGFDSQLDLVHQEGGLYTFRFTITSATPKSPQAMTLRWRIPSFNIKGVWKCGGLHDKRQQYDWEIKHVQSRISVDAPVLSVFGHQDENVMTFACSDAINLIEMNALLREEDNYEYCHLTFFSERHPEITNYSAELRVDTRPVSYAKAIQDVATWWESFDHLKPHPAPPIASVPLYSSWYQFHQDLDAEVLLKECKIAHDIGYELIILDDGWQTMDSNRGYDYTGDWQPDRFPDMAGFVKKVQATGMKFGLWYSVPFCGKHSKAYQRFKGKFLTENHRWAPVFDPRYPEVRQYLIDIYTTALKDWNLDAFKLDFIDDFKVYPETVLTKENGRDYANVNAAVDRLLTDALAALRAIKPDIGIEFRQQYIGPALRKFGNMFRAFDCPNDAVSNRIRITDVKLLCGDSAVHSDMLTWHPEEKIELAALQVLNGFFAVPQMSVLLHTIPADHLAMIRFYTHYWKEHKDILLGGEFLPVQPLSNYPLIQSAKAGHRIIGLSEDFIVPLNLENRVDILNAKLSTQIVIRNNKEQNCRLIVHDCMGNKISNQQTILPVGLTDIAVPAAGMIQVVNE